MASPDNATQLYLYRVKMDGKGKLEFFLPQMTGTHDYNISPYAKYALHTFSNFKTQPATEWVSLPDHKPINESKSITKNMKVD